ncbi:MAG: hypothetical protein ACD_79C00961G0004 [uncultured bacterium]|nr:MAG: hypothetical protein ACD_79C00961G0004 [uncultured bacterium]
MVSINEKVVNALNCICHKPFASGTIEKLFFLDSVIDLPPISISWPLSTKTSEYPSTVFVFQAQFLPNKLFIEIFCPSLSSKLKPKGVFIASVSALPEVHTL